MSEVQATNDGTHTACPYCGVGCGVIASHDSQGEVSVRGDPDHPANAGRLCSKGMALAETFADSYRLTQPVIQGETVSWDTATARIADAFSQCIREHGHHSIGFYVSGQLLTEDYYVVNKFVKGWLGTANIDTNSRLCMASSVAGHKRAFGSDTVPGCYEDLDSAELIILVGSNLAWCHPVLYQRIMARKTSDSSLRIVVIDPRRSITADNADLHLQIKPDGDTALFNGLLYELHKRDVIDHDYVEQNVSGYDEAIAGASSVRTDELEHRTGVSADKLARFFDWVVDTEKTMTLYSQGVNQSSTGTDKVNAIINCHLASGRIGRPGMGPFSITGQPNAMGGREVGGLATMLACHRDLDNPLHQSQVQRFWDSPFIAEKAGLTAVDLFDAVDNGSIKALWIMATNPVDSLPEANKIADALAKCPMVIVSEVTQRSDTLAYANIVLPAQAFGEKDGTVTNSERRISRQRRFVKPVGESKPDWWAVAQVANKMGYGNAFDYAGPADIFAEYARLSAFENNGTIDFDIGACADISKQQYNDLKSFQWPRTHAQTVPSMALTTADEKPIRFFASGDFFTPDGRARMIAVTSAYAGNRQLSDQYPLILNTGRIRDQWHTMTRTGYTARLMAHRAEPFVEINPADALIHGIEDADIVQINSPTGANTLTRAMLSDRQSPGHVFAPMHWTDQFASNARMDSLVQAKTDPVSRQPASKNQVVRIQRFAAHAFAYLLTRTEPPMHRLTNVEYWATSPVDNGWRTEIASRLDVGKLYRNLTDSLVVDFQESLNASSALQHVDYQAKSVERHGWFTTDHQLHSLLYLSSQPVELSRLWAIEALQQRFETPATRWQILAGRASSDQPDKGAIVCSCYNIGDRQIERAIRSGACSTTDAIGQSLGAGTNCGSCRNEIDVLIRQHCKPVQATISS